jgi:thiol-disulfide isomerase/thioredoxin
MPGNYIIFKAVRTNQSNREEDLVGIFLSMALFVGLIMNSCSNSQRIAIVENDRRERIALGEMTAGALLDSFPDFKKYHESYQVDQAVLSDLEDFDPEVEIFTVLGTWCDDSRREVPRFLKIMDALDSKKINLQFFGVDRSKKDEGGIAESYKIRLVPTFILLENGKEIGRIVERPKKSLEIDLADILRNRSGKE